MQLLRLALLLAQHKFEEAEEFAKKFSLDPEVSVPVPSTKHEPVH